MQENLSKTIDGKLTLLTGLHIGTGKSLKIGGVDAEVVRDPGGMPYIPGSSFKGKCRSVFRDLKEYDDKNEEVCKLFGGGEEFPLGCLLFRDAFVDRKSTSQNFFNNPDALNENSSNYNRNIRELFEVKMENKISRETGKAEHPRSIERVQPGVVFDIKVIYRHISNGLRYDEAESILEEIWHHLGKHNYLGGSGSRGYGHVSIKKTSSASL